MHVLRRNYPPRSAVDFTSTVVYLLDFGTGYVKTYKHEKVQFHRAMFPSRVLADTHERGKEQT